MPPVIIKILFAAFSVHFALFFRLALKRRKVYSGLLSLTFLLLVASYALRIWLPQAEYHEHKLFWYFRMSALATSATALVLILRRKLKKTVEQPTDS